MSLEWTRTKSGKGKNRWRTALPLNRVAMCASIGSAWSDNPTQAEGARRCGQEPSDVGMMGAMGELAVCDWYGVEPEWVFGGPDGGFDLSVSSWTMNVKAVPARYSHDPHLKVRAGDRVPGSDAYMLVVVDIDHGWVEIVGWATRGEVMATGQSDYYGRGMPCYRLTEDMLRRPSVSTHLQIVDEEDSEEVMVRRGTAWGR